MKIRIAIAAALALVSAAGAQTVFNTSVTPSWDVGLGQPNTNFVVNNNTTAGVQLGFSSFYRFAGGQDFIDNNTYGFQPGPFDVANPSLAKWNANWHINLDTTGSSGLNLGNTTVELTIDWDPTAGINTRTYNLSAIAIGQSAANASLSLTQASQNLGFSFWSAIGAPVTFDPNAVGTYEFTLSASQGSSVLSSVQMFVQVPTPGSAAVLGMAGVIAARRRRSN